MRHRLHALRHAAMAAITRTDMSRCLRHRSMACNERHVTLRNR
jgi:hypothetical protein